MPTEAGGFSPDFLNRELRESNELREWWTAGTRSL
jgi:hypothetical protein